MIFLLSGGLALTKETLVLCAAMVVEPRCGGCKVVELSDCGCFFFKVDLTSKELMDWEMGMMLLKLVHCEVGLFFAASTEVGIRYLGLRHLTIKLSCMELGLVEIFKERFVVNLFQLEAWSGYCTSKLEAACLDEHFRMPWGRLRT